MRRFIFSMFALSMAQAFGACSPAEPNLVEPTPCEYPSPSDPFGRIGDVIPPLTWNGIEGGEPVAVDLEKFYCGEQFEEYESLLFILVAEWCPECPAYTRLVDSLSEGLEFNKTKVIFVDLETNDFTLPSLDSANEYVSRYTDKFLRVGEGDSEPLGFLTERGARYIDEHTLWDATPNAFFIRKSDMQLVVRQQDAFVLLPFTHIAQSLEADWSNASNPPFTNNCDDDEVSEPNNNVSEAATLSLGERVNGGICEVANDFYFIDTEGGWRLDLQFTHWRGDLDVHLVDENGEDRIVGNRILGSQSEDDNEVVVGNGPTYLRILAKGNQSAPYELRISAVE